MSIYTYEQCLEWLENHTHVDYTPKDLVVTEEERLFNQSLVSDLELGEPTYGGCGFNQNHTEESKRKMSISHTGLKQTEQHKKHISISLKGKKKSPSHVENIKRGLGRRCVSPDGEVYVSLQEASRQTGIPHTSLHRLVSGNKKGWSWCDV